MNNIGTTKPIGLKMYVDNVGSSSTYKNMMWQEAGGINGSSDYYYTAGTAFWNNDTNAITGLEVTVSSGNIASGTCSLYGMN